MNNRKIIVFGGSGFIGQHLVKAMKSSGEEVTVFCRDTKVRFAAKNVLLVKGDITDYSAVEKNIIGKDVVINLASLMQHDSGFDPFLDLDVNCRGQLNILEARRKKNSDSVFISIGTRSQFGKVSSKDLPIKEEHCQGPVSIYGLHKSAAEGYCSLYKRAFGLKSVTLRLPQVYGPIIAGTDSHNFVDKFIRLALKDGKFTVYGYGRDIKDLIYVDDVSDAIRKVMNNGISDGAYNIGSGKKITLKEIAAKIVSACGKGSFELAPFAKGKKEFELGSFYFDISRAKKELKWAPKVKFNEGIIKTIQSYRQGS
jgi:UDP-glucose 4-epimerase